MHRSRNMYANLEVGFQAAIVNSAGYKYSALAHLESPSLDLEWYLKNHAF